MNKEFKIGQLVKWYTSYADDPDIIKDAGKGIILNIKDKKYTKPYKLFDVYRFKKSDIISVTTRDIEHLKE